MSMDRRIRLLEARPSRRKGVYSGSKASFYIQIPGGNARSVSR